VQERAKFQSRENKKKHSTKGEGGMGKGGKRGKKTIEEDRNLDNENIGSGMARVDFQPHQPQ
jgi:hypothetical protein